MSDEIFTVEQIRKLLFPVFKRHNMRKAIRFGSYARGEGKSLKQSDSG